MSLCPSSWVLHIGLIQEQNIVNYLKSVGQICPEKETELNFGKFLKEKKKIKTY